MSEQVEGQLTLFPAGFPASHSPLLGSEEARKMTATSGRKCFGLYKRLNPNGVVGENVSGIIRGALADILSDLEGAGYEARAYTSEARNVGGVFRGERIAVVAASYNWSTFMRGNGKFSANGEIEGGWNNNRTGKEKPDLWERWQIESRPYGVADGVPYRVDRLKCLGNAVVPQQFYPIFKAIAEVENLYHGTK